MNVDDKLALLLVGERNSAKGFLILLLQNSFAGVYGNVLSGDLMVKKSFETAERKNGCLAPLCDTPMCFSQEIDSNDIIDGNIWRVAVSGGDIVSYRVAYGHLEVRPIIGSITITSMGLLEKSAMVSFSAILE